jgi:hypothetical protein
MVLDSRDAGRAQPSLDQGWFVYIAFPFYLPYYLISTRRWRGLLLTIGIVLLFAVPWLAQWFVWLIEMIAWLFGRLVGQVERIIWLIAWICSHVG